jgi:hypothetical protein
MAILNEMLLYQAIRAMIGPSRTESRVNGTLGSRNAIQRMTWKVKICHCVEAMCI